MLSESQRRTSHDEIMLSESQRRIALSLRLRVLSDSRLGDSLEPREGDFGK